MKGLGFELVSIEKSRKSIFIVEDDEDLIEFYSFLIVMNDWEILAFTQNGAHAIEMYQNFNIKPDVVILDLDLPECSGIEVANRILDHSPNQSLFFISGKIHLLNDYPSFKNSPKLQKPFDTTHFLMKLSSLLSTE